MTKQSLAALRQVFEVRQPRKMETDAKAFLIRVARRGIARITQEQTGRAGVVPSVETYANTPANRNIDSVKLPGPIVARFDYRREIALFTLEALRKASPVVSGKYRNSHTILLNGQQVDVLPQNIPASAVITIVNPVPYARRLEIGKTESGRDFVIRVPNRIYERTAKQVVLPRYRRSADIRFTYIDLAGAHTVRGGLTSHYTVGEFGPAGKHRKRKRSQRVGSNVRAPAIEIRPRQIRVV
jgi:hypothetical protein